jgi:hypothetical protein
MAGDEGGIGVWIECGINTHAWCVLLDMRWFCSANNVPSINGLHKKFAS